jgi:hypothetical protein
MEENYMRRIDDLGRIWIPKGILSKMFSKDEYFEGYPMHMFLENNRNIIICKNKPAARFCEWEYNTNLRQAESKCDNISIDQKTFEKLKYCPYCGKQIKLIYK